MVTHHYSASRPSLDDTLGKLPSPALPCGSANRSRRWLILAMASLLLAGCGGGPQAPSLRNGPVYHNRSAGFRFLVPQGWNQSANAVLPDGTLERDFKLVQYQLTTSPQGGMFEVVCYERDRDPEPIAYHSGPSYGVAAWTPLDKPTEAKIGGKPAQRYRFSAQSGGVEMIKDVWSYEQGSRVIAFIGLYGKPDEAAAEEVRRATDSVVWD